MWRQSIRTLGGKCAARHAVAPRSARATALRRSTTHASSTQPALTTLVQRPIFQGPFSIQSCRRSMTSLAPDTLADNEIFIFNDTAIVSPPREKNGPETFAEAVKATQADSSKTIAIGMKDRTFLIVCPPVTKNLVFGTSSNETAEKIQNIMNDLSGVTDFSDYTFALEGAKVLQVETHQTRDAWLVAEFLEMITKVLPDENIFISQTAQDAIDSRQQERTLKRRPIAEVEEVRHPEWPLHPHQFEGVRFLNDNKGRGLLAFDMGLGKTLTALAYVASMQKRALVVAPVRVIDQWVKEASSAFPKYFQGRTVVLGSFIKRKAEEEEARKSLKQASLVLVNYESFKRFSPMLKKADLDTIIVDESQKIKNPKSQRTKLLLDHKDFFQHRILLSGTPLKNRVEEFQTQLDFLGYEGAYDIGASMSPGKLWNTLAEQNIYLRRSIAAEFPHLRFKDPEIYEVHDASADLRMDEGGFELQDADGRELRTMVFEKLAATALFKAPSTANLCAEVLRKATDDKMVIFTERKKCAHLLFDSIEQQGPDVGALLHHGGFSDADRLSILEQFRDPNSGKRVLVTTRQSMAEGVNLQCANRVMFNDLPWTPADISQAAARTKRLNQTKEVSEYWIIADTEFDQNLMTILRRKRRLVQEFMDGKNNKISQEEQRWMDKAVSIYEIIYGPGYKKKPKRRR